MKARSRFPSAVFVVGIRSSATALGTLLIFGAAAVGAAKRGLTPADGWHSPGHDRDWSCFLGGKLGGPTGDAWVAFALPALK